MRFFCLLPLRLWWMFLCGLLAGACFQDLFSPSADAGAVPISEKVESATTSADGGASVAKAVVNETAGLSVPGKEPAAIEAPGPDGPFVEPALDRRPAELFSVVVAKNEDPEALADAAARLAKLPMVPIGYPALDQAGSGFKLVAGKFARKAWASALARALSDAGLEGVQLVARPYHFDRQKPAINAGPHPKAGRVFAGMAGVGVPVLAEAGTEAGGSGKLFADGSCVTVLGEKWVGKRLWYRVRQAEQYGYLPAGRVLVDANVFAAPGGQRAVLGVGLGCYEGSCRWDYWLVDRGYGFRRLLKSAGERMPHAMSPDGRFLAYTTFDPSVLVAELAGPKTFELGPGTSPSFSPDSQLLFFRGPGIKGLRDQVFVVEMSKLSEGGKPAPRKVLDFRGEPLYPRAIATVPPQVDFLGPDELFTLFFRKIKKSGRMRINRWGVRFTPEGRVLEKAGVAISD